MNDNLQVWFLKFETTLKQKKNQILIFFMTLIHFVCFISNNFHKGLIFWEI